VDTLKFVFHELDLGMSIPTLLEPVYRYETAETEKLLMTRSSAVAPSEFKTNTVKKFFMP
jgi:hypothetical protein